jgi:SAM-dependent methyltransferase
LSSPYDKLKEGMRWMWSLGDYTRLAEILEPQAKALADICKIRPGATVLDVAAGNGNFAFAAARRGAIVTASDLTPLMVELGHARSATGQSHIEWTEADAEQLPFADAGYEIVASVFGAMFAPRPQLVASELFRVTKPGGLVAMANYSPGPAQRPHRLVLGSPDVRAAVTVCVGRRGRGASALRRVGSINRGHAPAAVIRFRLRRRLPQVLGRDECASERVEGHAPSRRVPGCDHS